MKATLKVIVKSLLRMSMILLITIGIVAIGSHFFGFTIKTGLFIIGAIYLFIGAVSVQGDTKRRMDVEYLQIRSMSGKGSMDEIGKDKVEMDTKSAFVVEMSLLGGILFFISGWVL